jgi:hypothetical protein
MFPLREMKSGRKVKLCRNKLKYNVNSFARWTYMRTIFSFQVHIKFKIKNSWEQTQEEFP